jgi:putative FmdB family regulatory protein
MPIFEYKCEKCGLTYEKLQSREEVESEACPECAGKTRRLLGPFGIVLRGGGFYSTDNREAKGE